MKGGVHDQERAAPVMKPLSERPERVETHLSDVTMSGGDRGRVTQRHQNAEKHLQQKLGRKPNARGGDPVYLLVSFLVDKETVHRG
jgi:hypothetical protein